jgi:hypothetical protein
MRTLIVIVSILTAIALAHGQGSTKLKVEKSPTSPLYYYCCDNDQASGQYAGDSSGVYDYDNCSTEIHITVRECIDRTRDKRICNEFSGSAYCRENPNASYPYPRYYALFHPIGVSPSSMSFNANYGGGNPSDQVFYISNGVWNALQIDYTLNWSASKNQNWLSLSSSSGTVSGNGTTGITVSVNISGLSPGTYQATITLGASEVSSLQNETIQVTLKVFGVSISGSTQLDCDETGYWTASASGGATPYSYQWYYYVVCDQKFSANSNTPRPLLPPCGSWIAAGSNSSSYSRSGCVDFKVKCIVTDDRNSTATSNVIYVTIGGSKLMVKGTETYTMPVAGEKITTELSGDSYTVSQNYPNPFNPSTEIGFTLVKSAYVTLAIYDLMGRELSKLIDQQMEAGYHNALWNANDMSSGVYLYRLSRDNQVEVRKIVLMK